MHYAAIALYVLGMPLAGLVSMETFNESAATSRSLLGLPPRRMTPGDKVAVGLAVLLWPVLGLICYTGMVMRSKKKGASNG